MKQVHVVAGVVIHDGEILCMQKGATPFAYTAFRWEFPGGKIEAGETAPEALRRELIEEMDMEVVVGDALCTVRHAYPDFEITMEAYYCFAPVPEFNRKEHAAHRWLPLDALPTLPWCAADVPIVEAVMRPCRREVPALATVGTPEADEAAFVVRPSAEADLLPMRLIFEEAKLTMRASGNAEQWAGGYPSDALLLEDMRLGQSYIVEAEAQAVATFVLARGEDPTYRHIFGGRWLDAERPYATIHRIASRRGYRGIASAVMAWAAAQCANLRVDTHRDNAPMRHLLQCEGFAYCGIIYLADGQERLAFQRIGDATTPFFSKTENA